MKNRTLEYLLKQEWSMGNGQCPECYGVSKSWHGHPLHKTSASIGHARDCELAAAINGAGGEPLMLGAYKNDTVYEDFIDGSGFMGTRPKTVDGCPKLKASQDAFEKLVFARLCRGTS